MPYIDFAAWDRRHSVSVWGMIILMSFLLGSKKNMNPDLFPFAVVLVDKLVSQFYSGSLHCNQYNEAHKIPLQTNPSI